MLSLSEYVMREPLPLAEVHGAILEFCRDRDDLCVFGAQALSQHTPSPRMTQDVDILAEDPEPVADDLARYLSERFPQRMAARVRAVRRGGQTLGYRVYQQRGEDQGGNRHLADVRVFDVPRHALTRVGGVQFTGPALTLAMKVWAATSRTNSLKRDQDRVDARRLMLALPDLDLEVLVPLWNDLGAPPEAAVTFEELRRTLPLGPESDADDFY